MSIRKRKSNTPDTTPLTVLVTSNGSLYMLLLLARRANASVASRAAAELKAGIRARVVALLVSRAVAVTDIAPDLSTTVEGAVQVVEAALNGCRARSPRDFMAWLERIVVDYLDGDPATPVALAAMVEDADIAFLGLSSAPRAERAAVLEAVLQRLDPSERAVVEARMRHPRSWAQVAAAVGMCEFGAKRLHVKAVDRAQLHLIDVLSELEDRDGGKSSADQDAA